MASTRLPEQSIRIKAPKTPKSNVRKILHAKISWAIKGKPMPTKIFNLNSGCGQQSVAQKKITDENTKIDDPKKLSKKKMLDASIK